MSDDGEDAPPSPLRQQIRYLIHAGLFLATFITTTAAGALNVHASLGDRAGQIAPIADGLGYSIPLMLILLCHELGHYVVARLHGVKASLPYFIPLPPGMGLGTLGAVIGMRDVTSDRKKLIDIGAAGPLCGMIVTIPVLWYGLAHSPITPVTPNSMQEGNSLLYALLKFATKGEWLPNGGRDVLLHPTAFAGWAGLLITMINLLPLGQLDGGHVASAYFGNGYNAFADRFRRALPLVALGVFFWVARVAKAEGGPYANPNVAYSIAAFAAVPWMMWSILVSLLRWIAGNTNHPPVDETPLPRSRKLLFWITALVFVAVFMPVWLRITAERAPAPARTSISETL